ncbi:MAG TPA: hypothetical protein VK348_00725, partial [Planctomycetota bacterium]|nr:hypothetical protein [Planctomycetota bacterium]
MFDRFIRLAKAKKALQAGRLEVAIQLADDPLVKEDRRASVIRQQAIQALFERAKRRSEDGDAAIALADLQRVLALGGHPGADVLATAVQRRIAERGEQDGIARRENAEARRLAEHGQLPAAIEMNRQAEARSVAVRQERSVANFIAERRNRAEEHLAAAADHLENDPTRALAEYRRATALDRAAAEQATVGSRLRRIAADRLAPAIAVACERGEYETALRCCREQLADWPTLRGEPAVEQALGGLADRLCALLRAGSPEANPALVRQLAAFDIPLPAGGVEVCRAAQLLVHAGELRDQGKLVELLACLREASSCLGGNVFVEQVHRLAIATADCDTAIERARGLAADGDLSGARGELSRLLQEWPMHEVARRELAIVDQGSLDREQRLQTVREAARVGRLREALGLALAQAVPGPAGEEARMLAKEVRARVDLVGRGLDQVRAALHGREAATADGVQHCLKRVEELGKVAVDHEEIPRLVAALQAELEGLELCDRAQTALEQRAWSEGAQSLDQLMRLRDRLLSGDRLDARALSLADQFLRAAEDSLSAGRLDDLSVCLGGVECVAVAKGDLARRAQSLRTVATEQRARADHLVEAAQRKLAD